MDSLIHHAKSPAQLLESEKRHLGAIVAAAQAKAPSPVELLESERAHLGAIVEAAQDKFQHDVREANQGKQHTSVKGGKACSCLAVNKDGSKAKLCPRCVAKNCPGVEATKHCSAEKKSSSKVSNSLERAKSEAQKLKANIIKDKKQLQLRHKASQLSKDAKQKVQNGLKAATKGGLKKEQKKAKAMLKSLE